ncbi:unnamed protein product [Cylicocyclus nassatus]|uniref:Carbohydrate sulfotransferase n=1 Tax=Cylicocyclus nassatus TaxID=53992 RepID=A0AA36DKF7_CYLNA|nr:unnamed protein product [Cylicocyclus nassatus]
MMLASSKSFVLKSMILSCFATLSVIFYGDRLRTENLEWQEAAFLAKNKSHILPPFIRYREQYLVIDKYRLATCQIEKIMSTIRGAIFCFLTDSKKFLEHNRTISNEPWKKKERFCKERSYVHEDLDKTLKNMGQDAVLFTIVRDPVERLISGFVDKCLR